MQRAKGAEPVKSHDIMQSSFSCFVFFLTNRFVPPSTSTADADATRHARCNNVLYLRGAEEDGDGGDGDAMQ